MGWLDRIRGDPAREDDGDTPQETPSPTPERRGAPALEALIDGLDEDGGKTILDLGAGSQAHLSLYGRFARRIRFAGLLPRPPHGRHLRAALRALASHADGPYGVVVAWDLLDWLADEQRVHLIRTLAQLSGPNARLYAMVDASGQSTLRPTRHVPLGPGRISREPVGRPEPAGRPLLPAEVEDLLTPFRVARAFTLRLGRREYFAVKDAPAARSGGG